MAAKFLLAEEAQRGLPPGPLTSPAVQVLRWARDPIAFLEECADEYGDAFTVRLAARPPLVFFSNPADIQTLFTEHAAGMCAGEANAALTPLLGARSMLLLDGLSHERQRRLLSPMFNGCRMHAYGPLIQRVVRAAVGTWPVGAAFPMHPQLQSIALEVILQIVIDGCEHTTKMRVRGLLLQLLSAISDPVVRTRWSSVSRGRLRRVRRLRRELETVLSGEIDRREHGPWHHDHTLDLLSWLIDLRDETGKPLSMAELLDSIVTLLVAGHETTATSLAWLFSRVLVDPLVMQRLRGELGRVVGSRSISLRHMEELAYLRATIDETLRLNPVFAMAGRVVKDPLRVGPFCLRPGVIAAPCIYLAHRRRDVWEHPEVFDPERFLRARPTPYEFFPFGGGDRRCLGMSFALYEMKIVAAEILSAVVLYPAAGYTKRPMRRSITLAPSDGVCVTVAARLH